MKRNIELVKAARLGDLEKVKNILETTEKFEYNELYIAMHYAFIKDYRDIVKLLLIYGGNLHKKLDNIDSYSINSVGGLEKLLIFYCKEGDFEMAELLIDSGANVNSALRYASKNGHLEIVKLLIDSGANVNAKDDNNNTVLMYASANGYLEVVKYLLDKGADIN
ncbi:ankyrin repeat domain-containing protein, partial [Brachyspira pulli]|uniref:ankyrin repeat domain-containing protein n=1 Tax=Brachyspira pulli TaxID=310721 RepID=UPI003003E3E0